MSTRTVLEIFGWISSGLIVLSLAQGRVWRFRIMNFAGAALGTMYNAVLGIWPFAAMNAVITVIDAYWMVRLSREGRPAAYDLLKVDHDDPYVQHFLKIHAKGTRSHFPHFDPQAPTRATVLVLRGDETVGVVAISDTTDRTAHVSLDYVTDRFRDYTPATYVYEDSGLFEHLGVEHIEVPGTADHKYLRRMGFRPHQDEWVREVRP